MTRTGSTRHVKNSGGRTSTWSRRGAARASNFGRLRARLLSYAEQAARFRALEEKANAEVILSNHPGLDGTHRRIAALRTRTAGQTHPFVVGNAVVQRYLRGVEQCAYAALEIVPS